MYSSTRLLTLIGGMLIGIPLFSQTGMQVTDIVPAHDGVTMSVTESQTGKYSPRYGSWSWDENGQPVDKRIDGKKRTAGLFGKDDGLWYVCGEDSRLVEKGGRGIVFCESVSRNEFGIDRGVFPCPSDSALTAFYRKDESDVTIFPLLDIDSRTGSLVELRYPMNGMTSERLSLGVYDARKGSVTYIDCNDFTEERYLTGVTWSADGSELYIQVLDRSQHHMHLNRYRVSDGSFAGTVLTEDNDAWIEPDDPVWPLDAGHFIYRTDNRDGYRSLYLCDLEGNIRRMTCCDADVAFKKLVPCKGGWWLYYTSAEVSPVENHLFRMKVTRLSGVEKARFSKPERLTVERGWHDVSINADGSMFIDRWSSFGCPGGTDLRLCDGTLVRHLTECADPLKDALMPEVQFGTMKAADGVTDNWFRFFKPADFDPSRKYPLVVYVYGGPHSQMVQDRWLGNIRMWEMAMAQRGYAVYVQDNRGTSNRGAAFEKAINRQCGQVEMADQMAGLEALLEANPWIDRERIGVHGWSYGGFMTITLATSHPDIFKTAVAGGPVIDWKWYEVMYGERYMDTPETNPEGFRTTSLIGKASPEMGRLLVIQGAIDNTVVWEHSLSFVQQCIEDGIQLDYFPYPKSEHNMRDKARLHLYEKITDYFVRNL